MNTIVLNTTFDPCGSTDNEVQLPCEGPLQKFSGVNLLDRVELPPSPWTMVSTDYISDGSESSPTWQAAKRVLDVVGALAALTLGFPVFALLALWVKATSPGPIFFGHTRIGKNGRRFKVWKFRSMVTNATDVLRKHLDACPELRAEWEATFKLKKDPRITAAGRFLRTTSLDELPQLWNVLMGDMSLVGPRPIVDEEIERYRETYQAYQRVRPGITGYWQVSGRNLTTYERRVELDEFYIRNWSIWFDLYILCRTVKTALLREGAF